MKLSFTTFFFLLTGFFSGYSQNVTNINFKNMLQELVKEKLITKAQSKKIDRVYIEKEKINRKETIEIFLNSTQEPVIPPYDSILQLEEVEELVNYALKDTTGAFKGNSFTIPLPNTFGSFWISVDRKQLAKQKKQYERVLDIFHKQFLINDSEKEKIRKRLETRTLMFNTSFFKLCMEEIKE